LRLYKIQLRLVAISNILDSASAISLLTNPKHLKRGKSEYQAPFRVLLFALTVRCARLFEEVSYHLTKIVGSDEIWGKEGTEKVRFIESKRKQLSRVQELLEKKSLDAAIEGLVETNIGLEEFEESLEADIQRRIINTEEKKLTGGKE